MIYFTFLLFLTQSTNLVMQSNPSHNECHTSSGEIHCVTLQYRSLFIILNY